MEEKCLCEPTEILIFPCSGGSNVGQIANQAGVKLTQDGRKREGDDKVGDIETQP